MKTTRFFFAFLIALAFANGAYADKLTGTAAFWDYKTIHDAGSTEEGAVTPILVHNKNTNQDFIAFCGDFRTSTSSAFASAGQEYGAYSLFSENLTVYSDAQKSMINDLYAHTYASAFNVEAGTIKDMTLTQAIQLALWEILTETDKTLEYSLTSGTFYTTESGTFLIDTANSFLNALQGLTSWETIGFGDARYDYDMTVYVAGPNGTASQTLISITAPTATPEPASMLIFGLGLAAGLPMIRRRMKK